MQDNRWAYGSQVKSRNRAYFNQNITDYRNVLENRLLMADKKRDQDLLKKANEIHADQLDHLMSDEEDRQELVQENLSKDQKIEKRKQEIIKIKNITNPNEKQAARQQAKKQIQTAATQKISENYQKKQLDRIYDFPALYKEAQIHTLASKYGYGIRRLKKKQFENILKKDDSQSSCDGSEGHGVDITTQSVPVCPCCQNLVVRYQIPICYPTSPPQPQSDRQKYMLETGVSMYFQFIKMVIKYLIIRFLLFDLVNIILSQSGDYCSQALMWANKESIRSNLPVSETDICFFTTMSAFNLKSAANQSLLNILDICSLVMTFCTIAYFVLYKKYEYKLVSWLDSNNVSQQDYSVLLQNIPTFVYSEGAKVEEVQFKYELLIKKKVEEHIQGWLKKFLVQKDQSISNRVIEQNYQKEIFMKTAIKIFRKQHFDKEQSQNLELMRDCMAKAFTKLNYKNGIVQAITICFDLNEIESLNDLRKRLLNEHVEQTNRNNKLMQEQLRKSRQQDGQEKPWYLLEIMEKQGEKQMKKEQNQKEGANSTEPTKDAKSLNTNISKDGKSEIVPNQKDKTQDIKPTNANQKDKSKDIKQDGVANQKGSKEAKDKKKKVGKGNADKIIEEFAEVKTNGNNQLSYLPNQIKVLNEQYIKLCDNFSSNDYGFFGLSHFTGKAIVSFQFQHYRDYFLREYDNDSQFFKINGQPIRVSLTSKPEDVYWFNMKVTDDQRMWYNIYSNAVLFMLLVLSFASLLGLQVMQVSNNTDVSTENSLMDKIKTNLFSIMMALLTNVINYILGFSINLLADLEKHRSKTQKLSSLTTKIIVSQTFNTAFIYYILYLIKPSNPMGKGGLVSNIFNLVMVSGVLNVVLQVVPPGYYISKVKYWWNYGGKQEINLFQKQLNEALEPPEFDFAINYAFYIIFTFVVSFYGFLVPTASPILIVIFFCEYWADKYNLLKRFSYPVQLDNHIIRYNFRVFQFSILLCTIGHFVWDLKIHYESTGAFKVLNLVNLVFASVFVAFQLFVPNRFKSMLYETQNEQIKLYNYMHYRSKNLFRKTYFGTNPATSCMLEFQIVQDKDNPKSYKKQKVAKQNLLEFVNDTEETYQKYLELQNPQNSNAKLVEKYEKKDLFVYYKIYENQNQQKLEQMRKERQIQEQKHKEQQKRKHFQQAERKKNKKQEELLKPKSQKNQPKKGKEQPKYNKESQKRIQNALSNQFIQQKPTNKNATNQPSPIVNQTKPNQTTIPQPGPLIKPTESVIINRQIQKLPSNPYIGAYIPKNGSQYGPQYAPPPSLLQTLAIGNPSVAQSPSVARKG